MQDERPPDIESLLEMLKAGSPGSSSRRDDPLRGSGRKLLRDNLDRARMQYVAIVRTMLRKRGISVRVASAKMFVGALRSLRMPSDLRWQIAPLLVIIGHLNQQIRTLDAGGRPTGLWMNLDQGRRSNTKGKGREAGRYGRSRPGPGPKHPPEVA